MMAQAQLEELANKLAYKIADKIGYAGRLDSIDRGITQSNTYLDRISKALTGPFGTPTIQLNPYAPLSTVQLLRTSNALDPYVQTVTDKPARVVLRNDKRLSVIVTNITAFTAFIAFTQKVGATGKTNQGIPMQGLAAGTPRGDQLVFNNYTGEIWGVADLGNSTQLQIQEIVTDKS
jgi:hypothetical protein